MAFRATNHSLRATAATRLYEAGIDEQLVMERTGHRSLEGVRSYKRTSSEQKEVVSDILSNANKRQCTEMPGNAGEVCASTATVPSEFAMTNFTENISLPSYSSSKSGAFNFSACTNVNINVNNITILLINYSETSLIRTPLNRAPPSTGHLSGPSCTTPLFTSL